MRTDEPMRVLSGLLASLVLSLPVYALVDSNRNYPAKIAGWTITSHHMDTGDLRSCSAKGKFGDLEVALGNSSGSRPIEISFRFVKGGAAPGPANPGDFQQACGSGKSEAPAGSWRYNPNQSSEEYCDGSSWLKPTEGHFKKAVLLLNGSEIATTQDGAHFKAGLISGKRVLFEYSAWFQRVDGEKKLTKPGKVELRVEGLDSGPIAIGAIRLNQALAEMSRCERERK
ncbi:MAG: hypothetical protein HY925_13710 [Elusimicrobia bacterium]|nr:hypothetical protein [Elusimicrobiota bacterium]